jgi:hypothetical protein
MSNKIESIIRDLVREEIENIFEDSVQTGKALQGAKDDLAKKTERVENANDPVEKAKAKVDKHRTQSGVYKKAADHLKELDKENKLAMKKSAEEMKMAIASEQDEQSEQGSTDLGI